MIDVLVSVLKQIFFAEGEILYDSKKQNIFRVEPAHYLSTVVFQLGCCPNHMGTPNAGTNIINIFVKL